MKFSTHKFYNHAVQPIGAIIYGSS